MPPTRRAGCHKMTLTQEPNSVCSRIGDWLAAGKKRKSPGLSITVFVRSGVAYDRNKPVFSNEGVTI